jgi:hypothetical protein
MKSTLKAIILLLIVSLPFPSLACDTDFRVEKKPKDLRMVNPNKNAELTFQDRLLWRSVLGWCDECEQRANPSPEYFDKDYGDISIYPLAGGEYIVDVFCLRAAYQREHLYYKVREHAEALEVHLLRLEQFRFIQDPDDRGYLRAKSFYDEVKEKGEFVRFTDPLFWGTTGVDVKKKRLMLEDRYRGTGGCGLLTIYDVSGDCPRVVEFRAKTYCSANYVPPEKWRRYPAKVRAKWRTASSSQREDWKDKDQCR